MAGILKVDTLQRVGSDSDQITLSAGSVDLINPKIKSSDGTTGLTSNNSGYILMPNRPAFDAAPTSTISHGTNPVSYTHLTLPTTPYV